MSKLKFRSFVLVISISFVCSILLFKIYNANKQEFSPVEQFPQPVSGTRKTARQILAEPIQFKSAHEGGHESKIHDRNLSEKERQNLAGEDVCGSEWQKFLGVSVESWFSSFIDHAPALEPQCVSLLENFLPDVSTAEALRNCVSLAKLADPNANPSEQCLEAALFFRAAAIDFLFRNNTDYASQTEEVLLNRILSGFLLKEQTPEKSKELIRMTEALIEKDPLMYPANKARASLLLMEQAHFNKGNQGLIEEALDRCAELNPEDREIQESRIALPVLFGKPSEMQSRAEDLLNVDPENPVALYFHAAALWENGDAPEAIATIEKLVKIAPGVSRYEDALEKVRAAKPREKGIFSVSLSMSLLNE